MTWQDDVETTRIAAQSQIRIHKVSADVTPDDDPCFLLLCFCQLRWAVPGSRTLVARQSQDATSDEVVG